MTASKSIMPPQTTQPFPPGANNIFTAGTIKQQQNATAQNALTQGGGVRRRRHSKKRKNVRGTIVRGTIVRGGAIAVPPVPSSAVDKGATTNNYTDITSLSANAQNNASYDKTTNPGQVAAISAQQQSTKTGGSKRRMKRGGSWPKWGCLSGGKKTRKRHKKRKSNRHKY